MKRAQLITRLRVAGYHDDRAMLVRLYVDHRIRYDKALRVYDEGRLLKKGGVRCDCFECKQKGGGK